MNREFVPYEQALEIKELGFNENCFRGYMFQYGEWIISDMIHDNICPLHAPLYQQAFRWFRDKYNLACYVICYELAQEDGHSYSYEIPKEDCYYNEHFDTYEEAELDLLKKLIKIVKNK